MKKSLFFIVLLCTVSACGQVTVSTDSGIEKPVLTAEQKEIIADGKELIWKENGLKWTIPESWNKLLERPDFLTYGLPSSGTMFVSLTPAESLEQAESINKKHYDRQLENAGKGLVEQVRYLEIAGIKGVEFIEKVPTGEGWRRYMWLAYREFNGKPQMIQVVCGFKEPGFEKNRAICASVLYSMEQLK